MMGIRFKGSAKAWLAVSMGLLILTSCSPRGLLRTDQVFVYNRALDYVYLRCFEAVDSVPFWTIYETDKENGRVSAWNSKYGSLFDADRRVVTFQLKRVSRTQTSVELAPKSRSVVGSRALLMRVDQYLEPYRVK
jgi:hypothetical protein